MITNNNPMKNKKKRSVNNKFFINKNDPLGSYTGNALDGNDLIQDADDL